jgi:hypothetical protein
MMCTQTRWFVVPCLALAFFAAGLAIAADGGAVPAPAGPASSPAAPSGERTCRLGAVNVPYQNLQWFIDLGYDFMAGVQHGDGPSATAESVDAQLRAHHIEHFKVGHGDVKISEMGIENVPPERRGLKRGPGHNKYTNADAVCAGWDEPYRFRGEKVAAQMSHWLETGVIFEDFLNRALCYCKGCEADYRRETGASGFPEDIYPTPHYEDTVAFDRTLLEWDQKRAARHFRLIAAPIHAIGKKVAVAGVCRWIVGPEAADAVDYVMFYTYYGGRRLPANFMRNWKYWHDHVVRDDPKTGLGRLWLIFGYFREYPTFHTRVMLANLPDGVNLTFWGGQRQVRDAACREDALYAADVASSRLVPIRIGVYDSTATRAFLGDAGDAWRERHVERAVLGFERLGLDASPISSLENLDAFELLYLEDVECLSPGEIDQIRAAKIPVLITGRTGLRDEKGQPWGDAKGRKQKNSAAGTTLNLPSPITLGERHLNVENEHLYLECPWFDFMFETCSVDRGSASLLRPYTDPSLYHGVRKQALSLIPSRTYGEFLNNVIVSHYSGKAIASTSESRQAVIVYDPGAKQVYSGVSFSDYVNVNDLTECGYGYEMRQFCFLQIIDALTMERRGIQVTPYLMTAVRRTTTGHFLTIGNVYDEPRTVTLTLSRTPKAVRINHQPYDQWEGKSIVLPPIGPKDAMQVHVDYP